MIFFLEVKFSFISSNSTFSLNIFLIDSTLLSEGKLAKQNKDCTFTCKYLKVTGKIISLRFKMFKAVAHLCNTCYVLHTCATALNVLKVKEIIFPFALKVLSSASTIEDRFIFSSVCKNFVNMVKRLIF